MRRKRNYKIWVVAVIAIFLLQAGFTAYSMMGGNILKSPQVAAADPTEASAPDQGVDGGPIPASDMPAEPDTGASSPADAVNADIRQDEEDGEVNTEISQQVLDAIRASDPGNYNGNINNYKKLLTDLNVAAKFKDEIERLIMAGKKLPDVLTAYSFLSDRYGKLDELEAMASDRESGKSWSSLFQKYDDSHKKFEPRSFDGDYLEKLMKTPGITQDEIMTADRVSQTVGEPFEAVIQKKLSGMTWRGINAEYGIVNGQEKIPCVQVTREQLQKYTQQGALTEDQVVGAFVLADKTGLPVDETVGLLKRGMTQDEIFARSLEARFY